MTNRVIVRRSSVVPPHELAAVFLFGQAARLTMGIETPASCHRDPLHPSLYETAPGRWTNTRDGRLLTPDPLAAAAGMGCAVNSEIGDEDV